MIFLLLLQILYAGADAPRKWENAKAIVERHEFYENGIVIVKPKESWQTLFALTFLDASFQLSKDCVYYRVPGEDSGKIKIKSLPAKTDCSAEILSDGDIEITEVTNLSYTTSADTVVMDFTRDGRKEKWMATILHDWRKPDPKLLLSSSDFKSPGFIYLAPAEKQDQQAMPLKSGTLCHDVTGDCEEKSPSTCSSCEQGWHEIPNGCFVGPKICGPAECGGKDQPACRRGMIWQRKEIGADCRVDSSFAWCNKGRSVYCDGDKAYCR